MITPRPDKSVKTVRDLVPVHEHPPSSAIHAIFKIARAQMRDIHNEFRDSNLKARLIRSSLTPEQLYIYEWISYIYTIMALDPSLFARQVGVSVQTLKNWLRQKGHLPSPTHFRRVLNIYTMNFTDKLARELLHGDKIGTWRRPYRPIWVEKQEEMDRIAKENE